MGLANRRNPSKLPSTTPYLSKHPPKLLKIAQRPCKICFGPTQKAGLKNLSVPFAARFLSCEDTLGHLEDEQGSVKAAKSSKWWNFPSVSFLYGHLDWIFFPRNSKLLARNLTEEAGSLRFFFLSRALIMHDVIFQLKVNMNDRAIFKKKPLSCERIRATWISCRPLVASGNPAP